MKVAEKAFGINHPKFGASLNNLAELYQDQGKYAEAETLYKLALKTLEKALGPDHPVVATVLENVAECYKNMGSKDEVEILEVRAK